MENVDKLELLVSKALGQCTVHFRVGIVARRLGGHKANSHRRTKHTRSNVSRCSRLIPADGEDGALYSCAALIKLRVTILANCTNRDDAPTGDHPSSKLVL